jgi:two-component system sensor histidine kinase MtrB
MTDIAAVTTRLRDMGLAVRHKWRGSLQLRVAATTLVVSALVTLLLGVVLLHQIRNGLLDAKTRASVTQFDFGLQQAVQQFDAANQNTIRRTPSDVVTALGARGSEADSYGVVLLSTDNVSDTAESGSSNLTATIPVSLKDVVTQQAREAWTYTTTTVDDGSRQPALVVGAPVSTNVANYQLYYVFPLSRERQTLALVERTMGASGVVLVLLLVAIAALVTRQVVRPVRQAAATAERLAAGRLRDRMPVRGEDDLASLATSFNRMAETVERQISQLRELSRVQRRFVADVSHELRTPVTTIRMAADLLHESTAHLPGDLGRSSQLLQTQLDRFESLLADLLEISRHDAGAVVLEAEPVDLRALVERVVDTTEPIAQRRGCVVAVDLPSEPVVVEVDARRIDRVLRNLVVNAVEHGAGQPVEVRLCGGAGGVAITVRDRGAGLRPGEAALVFGRFWRADPARARTSGGTGLGLSIALEDTRLHGGWLQAWGHPGYGSVFRLTLPWHAGEDIGESPLPLDPGDGLDGELPRAATAPPARDVDDNAATQDVMHG